jgi:hypothetical protein
VAAASRQYSVSCRTYKIPERKLGRHAILSSTAEEILKGRIKRLQQMGFGATRKHVSSFAFKFCEENIFRKKNLVKYT